MEELINRDHLFIYGLYDTEGKEVFVIFNQNTNLENNNCTRDQFVNMLENARKHFQVQKIDKMNPIVSEYFDNPEKNRKVHLIIVYNPFFDANKGKYVSGKFVNSVYSEGIEFFETRRLSIPTLKYKHPGPTPHPMSAQPKFMLINDVKEKKKIIERFSRGNGEDLSQMGFNDPINKYFNGKKGDIYKIIRGNRRVYYRKVH